MVASSRGTVLTGLAVPRNAATQLLRIGGEGEEERLHADRRRTPAGRVPGSHLSEALLPRSINANDSY